MQLFNYVLFKTFLLLNYSCPHFPPTTLPCPTHPSPSTFNPPIHHLPRPPLSLSMCPLHMFLDLILPFLSPITRLPPPLQFYYVLKEKKYVCPFFFSPFPLACCLTSVHITNLPWTTGLRKPPGVAMQQCRKLQDELTVQSFHPCPLYY